MKVVNYYIANANGAIDDCIDQINDAVKLAIDYVLPRLNIKQDIDIVFTRAMKDIVIPEIQIGGRTYSSNFIIIALGDEKNILSENIFQIICHELCHAIRWQYNDEWSLTLLDAMIFEGLASVFEEESAKDNDFELEYFINTISQRSKYENQEIINSLSGQFNNEVYNYDEIFFNGDNSARLPRWSGYSAGYYLVKEYMKNNNKNINEIFSEKYSVLKDSITWILKTPS